MRPIVNPPSTAHTPSPTHTLQAFEEMRARGCAPDTIVYNAIIDVLWETGVGWAQRRAVAKPMPVPAAAGWCAGGSDS